MSPRNLKTSQTDFIFYNAGHFDWSCHRLKQTGSFKEYICIIIKGN